MLYFFKRQKFVVFFKLNKFFKIKCYSKHAFPKNWGRLIIVPQVGDELRRIIEKAIIKLHMSLKRMIEKYVQKK